MEGLDKDQSKNKMLIWMKRLGWAGLIFFTIKGLLWLALIFFGAKGVKELFGF